jgi:hypothetical protein
MLTSPVSSNGALNHSSIILFSINSGLLLGSLYCFVLLGFYLLIKAYTELQRRSFVRRGALFGVFVTSLLLFKLYNFLDLFIAGFLILVFVAADLILSQKNSE